MTDKQPYFVTLPHRGLIHVEGTDRYALLQGIITNDLEILEAGRALYACLLTPQGKYLHDFFITEGPNVLLIECEGGERAQDLYKRLNMYRLRADVQVSVEENIPVYAVFNYDLGVADPRHDELGNRSFEKPDHLMEQPFSVWDEKRIEFTVPDGSRDMMVQGSTLLECNIDRLHGVSFEKGCYVGQELTARMHYRGLVKKRLYAVKSDKQPLPDFGVEIRSRNGTLIGEMRSSCANTGLALLKDALV